MSQNVMSGFFGQHYQQPEHGREMDSYLQSGNLPELPQDMDQTMTGEGQTLDQIISQNDRELQRRRSSYRQFSTNGGPQSHARNSSLMDFDHTKPSEEGEFQFNSPTAPSSVPNHLASSEHTQKGVDVRRERSRENLALDTRFGQVAPGFNSMPTYSQSMITSAPLDLDPSSHYLGHGMDMPLNFEGPGGDRTPMNVQQQMEQPNFFSASPEQQTFSPMFQMGQDSPAGAGQAMDQSLMDKVSRMQVPDTIQGMNVLQANSSPSHAMGQSGAVTTISSPQHIQQANSGGVGGLGIRGQYSIGSLQSTSPQGTEMGPVKPQHKFTGIYSQSGFDMLGVLTRVASRPKPEINIGPVDLSCAFVVCDIDVPDMPIVYCSDIFERFTGYSNTDILGKNCRFLQAPDGRVQPGVRRKYVDDRSVYDLKCKISRREEIQMGLVNYRKGGQPFVNLLTMIPITWDGPKFRYYVGFQVDVVEQPNSVAGRNSDGTYSINYQRQGQFPPYVLKAPERSGMPTEMGQTIPRDEVTAVLGTIGSGESELSKRIWDKVLLENSDDVVHVLSLKGLFLYLSPASRKVLEYDASELVGTALSSVCHPSDIVPVTRELKDTSSGAPVNVVFRIRRKHSGYTWFESHGCLHTEQGKGRKCIIMVGRERPVYAIDRPEVTAGGGIGDNELWSKMSTSGLFLFVASNSRLLLDRSPMELVGTSIQAMMRTESKKEFSRVLEQARKGIKATTFRHEMQNRRGQVLQAQTTIYPGDAEEGSKPTFLVAQTRFSKMTRSTALSSRPSIAASPRTDQASVGSVTPSASVSGSTGPGRSSATPQSSQSQATSQPGSWDPSAMTPQSGPPLAIGSQDEALASEDNIFDELKTTRSTSWQFELRQMERQNRILIEELQGLLSRRKKRKRRKGFGQLEKDCANCHTRVTPEWRRGPSGKRDLCNSCGLRWAKQNGRVSPRKPAGAESNDKGTASSPQHRSPAESSFTVSAKSQSGSTPGKTLSRLDSAGSGRASRPPKIEEGVES